MRFYEPMNKEVLLATRTEVVKEMFSLKPNDFGHPKNVQFMISQLTGSKFNFLSPHGHRVRIRLSQLTRDKRTNQLTGCQDFPQESQARLHDRKYTKNYASGMGQGRQNDPAHPG